MARSLLHPLVVTATAILSLTGCASYERDLRAICGLPHSPHVSAKENPDRATQMSSHMVKTLRSPEGVELFSLLANVDLAMKAELLEAEARSQGITTCAMAEEWRGMAKPSEAQGLSDGDSP